MTKIANKKKLYARNNKKWHLKNTQQSYLKPKRTLYKDFVKHM